MRSMLEGREIGKKTLVTLTASVDPRNASRESPDVGMPWRPKKQ